MKQNLHPKKKIFIALAIIFAAAFGWFAYNQFDVKQTLAFTKEIGESEEDEARESAMKLQYIEEAWRQEFEKTKDPETGTVPTDRMLRAIEVKENILALRKKDAASSRGIAGISWVERGPSNVGGRTRAVIFDKTDATNKRVFAGAIGGGLWRCNDITATIPSWTKISDTYENIGISSIVQSQTNPQIMYYSTGEGWGNLGAQNGLGIWKSTDAGNTWNHLPSTINIDFRTIQRLLITPNNDLYAAAAPGGVMKSTNGGLTWKQVLKGSAADLGLAANGDIYATLGIFSPGSVQRSPNGANVGEAGTWVNVTPPTTSGFQRIEIGLAPSAAGSLYALCQGGASNDATDMFFSVNSGVTWTACGVGTAVVQDPIPTNPNFTRGQAWYDLVCEVDPNTPTTVYIGGVDIHKSVDAGANFTAFTKWNNFIATNPAIPLVHADQHGIVFLPGNSDIALINNDGGIFYGTDLTNPLLYDIPNKNFGYNVTQFYAVAMRPEAGSNYFLAGAQDNGTQRFNTNIPGTQSTTEASGGDGAFCHIDQLDPSLQISSFVYSSYFRSTNSGGTFATYLSDATHGQFINPTDLDDNSKVLYGDYTLVATRVGGTYSRLLTTAPANNVGVTVPAFAGASVSNVYVSPNVANRVYFGLTNGSLVYVDNANTAVTPAAGTLIKTGSGTVSGIAIERTNEMHIVVTYSNFGVESIWETLDGGANWTASEGNLPDMPVRWVVFNPMNADQAIIATELGVWSTDDLNGSATEWNPTGNNMPNCRVDMLQVRQSDNVIAAATYGRGVFTTTLTNTTVPQINFAKQTGFVGERNPTTLLTCGTYGFKDVPVTLYISQAPVGDAVVNLSINPNSTATSGIDYTLSSTSVTFPSGSTTPQVVNVRVFNDHNIEPTEYLEFNMAVSGATNAVKATINQSFSLQIDDDELAPSAAFVGKVQVGELTTNLGGSSPLQGSQSDKKMQFLYRASELLASGIKPGDINGFTFTVGTKGSTVPYNGLTIKMGQTPNEALAPGPFLNNTSFVTVFSATGAGYSTTGGDNEFTFSTPFIWDGTSSIVFEYCYNNTAAPPASPVAIPVGTGDDVLRGQTTSYVSQARAVSANVPADNGCAFMATTLSASNTFRPLIKLHQLQPQTPVETVLNSDVNYNLGPFETVFFYNAGKVMARVENLSGFNYGCVNLKVDRAGNNAVAFNSNIAGNFLTSKSLLFTPQFDDPTGALNFTLYYTDAEKTGWELATGKTWSQASIIKVKGRAIKDVTPSSPATTATKISTGTTIGRLDVDHFISGNFASGFSGVAVGVFDATVLAIQNVSLTGTYIGNNSILKWNVNTDFTLQSVSLQRSFNGLDYSDINSNAFVGSGNYSFTDAPSQSKVYYRMKFITAAGATQFSNIVLLNKNNKGNINVSPNPFTNFMIVQLNNPTAQNVTVELFDIIGNRLYYQQIKNFNGQQLRVDLQNKVLTSGTYILNVQVGDSKQAFKVMHY